MWPHDEFPLMPVGKLTLNRNPSNYFAEVEQLAFSPAHLVPGIEPRYAMSCPSRDFLWALPEVLLSALIPCPPFQP